MIGYLLITDWNELIILCVGGVAWICYVIIGSINFIQWIKIVDINITRERQISIDQY